jgi:hypothetical protein
MKKVLCQKCGQYAVEIDVEEPEGPYMFIQFGRDLTDYEFGQAKDIASQFSDLVQGTTIICSRQNFARTS